jgi:GntR family transcriptional regulator, N-acetylglucosamine utilization regulator
VEFANLDRQSVVPLYYQIQQRLLEGIRSGQLKAGKPVPSEEAIARRLGVSRMTARQALKSLCHLGVAYSQRGKGTFVSGIKIEKNFRQVLSFSEEMEARGTQACSRVLSFESVAAGAIVTGALRLSPKEKVVRLRRVRMANGSPVCVECTCLPLRLCPDLIQKFDPRASLYRTLWELHGIRIEAADEVVEVGLAKVKESKLLRIASGSPVFLITRTSYVQDGQPVEYVKSTYRGDRFKIANRLTRQEKAN